MKDATSIGRKGEHLFRGYCVDEDVTCNKAYDDDYGWDYFIEFPPEARPGVPIDMHPAHASALVQIKTTRNYAAMSRSLKLSNALRMAKSPYPFFLVLIHTKRGHEPRIFVLHVWTDFIAKTLRAARMADNQRKTATHNQSLTISFSSLDDHTADLLPFIKSEINAVKSDYAAAKRKIVDTVGFERGNGTMNLTFEMESDDDLFDLLLGRRQSLDLVRLEHISERFGIAAGEAEITEGPAKLSVEPHTKKGSLRLRSASGDEQIVPAEITHAFIPDADDGLWRTRIVAGCLEIVRGTRMNTAHAMVNPDKSSLADIDLYGALHRWGSDGPVDLLLTVEGKRVDLGKIDIGNGPPERSDWIRTGMAAGLLRQLCAAAMVQDVPISVSEIAAAYLDLEYMAALASDRAVKIAFNPAPNCPPVFAHALGYLIITVGQWTITVLAQRPVPHQTTVDGLRELYLGPVRILDAQIEKTAEAHAPDQIEEHYNDVLKRLDVNDDVFELGDLRAFINAGLETDGQPTPSQPVSAIAIRDDV